MVLPPLFLIDGVDEFGRESMQELYDFIDAQSGPWFAWVAPMLPHALLDPPEDLRALYTGLGLIDQAVDYFGNVTRMDRRVGEVRAFLDERGLTDDTVIIYVGDNGWEQPLYPAEGFRLIGGDRGKLSVHDRGFRTPIIVRWPAEVLPGRRTDRIVTFEDVFETILDYAGAPSHDCSGGASFRRVADDGRGPWRRRRVLLRMSTVRYPTEEFRASYLDDDPDNDLPISDDALGLYFRSGRRWAYSSVLERGVEQLYDLRRDPMGLSDLSEVRRGRVRGLRRRALRWNEELEAVRCPVTP
jgi:arylsulfatase A-like enzyme